MRVQASCSVACFPGWVRLTFPLGQTLVVHFCCSDTEGVSCQNATYRVILHWCCLSLMACQLRAVPPLPCAQLSPNQVADSVGGKLISRGAIGSGVSGDCFESHVASSTEVGLDPGRLREVLGCWLDSGRGHMQRGRSPEYWGRVPVTDS